MPKFLGETPMKIADTPFANYTPKDWAMYFIGRYGQIDGDHHKAWVLDQASRILLGTPVVVVKATWDDGQSEYRVWTEEMPSNEYVEWVKRMRDFDAAGVPQYSYWVGTPP